eukprot:COSAG06_NODE_1563_length_9093_cov_9.891495_1_plen_39_part_00
MSAPPPPQPSRYNQLEDIAGGGQQLLPRLEAGPADLTP